MDSYNNIMDNEYGNLMYTTMSNNQLPIPNQLQPQNLDITKDSPYLNDANLINGPSPSIPMEYREQSTELQQQQHPILANVPMGNGETSETYLSNPMSEYVNSNSMAIDNNDDDDGNNDENQSAKNVDGAAGMDGIAENPLGLDTEQLDHENPVKNNVDEDVEKMDNNDENIVTGQVKEEVGTIKTEDESITDPKPESTEIKEEVIEEKIDENQCRVCLSKDDLINIFTYEKDIRISAMLMKICTSVKILEKDYLPHYICSGCLDKLRMAYELKHTCEQTDKELRLKLRRLKPKARQTGRYLIIDCELDSTDDDAKKKNENDDDEFHVSDAVESDSDGSYEYPSSSKRKKSTHTKKRNGSNKKTTPTTSIHKKDDKRSRPTRNSNRISSPITAEVIPIHHVFVEAPRMVPSIGGSAAEQSDDDDDDEDSKPLASRSTRSRGRPTGSKKKSKGKKRTRNEESSNDADSSRSKKRGPYTKKNVRVCDLCNQPFSSWTALKEHRKTHKGEKPLQCHICNKPFKQRASLDVHIQRHEDDDTRTCKPCNKLFATKTELRKHQYSVHESEYTMECEKCKRTFTSKQRLDKHKDGKCPGFDTSVKKKSESEPTPLLGRDLFKCVAPLTSTYWSDSFSD